MRTRRHWYCFLARRSDGSLLSGAAEDVSNALRSLNAAGEAAFLAYTEEFMNEQDALRRSESLRRMRTESQERLLAVSASGAAEEFLGA